MTTTPLAPADLFASAPHLHPGGDVRAAERRMTHSDPGAWQLATFHVETGADMHADHWEMHPEAEDMVRLRPGTAVIVPRGRRHRLELDAPSDLMSITLRHGTRLEKRTGTR